MDLPGYALTTVAIEDVDHPQIHHREKIMAALSTFLVDITLGFSFAALALLVILYIMGMQTISESALRPHDKNARPMLPTPL